MGCCKSNELDYKELLSHKLTLNPQIKQLVQCQGDQEEPNTTFIKTNTESFISALILPEYSNDCSIASWKFQVQSK